MAADYRVPYSPLVDAVDKADDQLHGRGKKEEKTLGDKMENYFKLFAASMFLLGAPMAIGLLAVGIFGFLVKQGYDIYKARKSKGPQDIVNGVTDILKGEKENGTIDFNKDIEKQLRDLAYDKDGNALSKDQFHEKLFNTIAQQLRTKEGRELVSKPEFQNAFKKLAGDKASEALQQTIHNFEMIKDEIKNDTFAANDVTEDFKDIFDEKPEEKENDVNKDNTENKLDSKQTNKDNKLETDKVEKIEVDDKEFDSVVASPEEVRESIKAPEVTNELSKDTNININK